MDNPTAAARAADTWNAGFFASDYGAPYAASCQHPVWAQGMCSEVSETFADYLRSIGQTSARTVDLDATEAHPYIPAGAPHTVVEVGDLIVDLTHRQFDPDATVPHTADRTAFLTGWRVVSYD